MGTDTRRLRQPVDADPCIAANRLACYVFALSEYDDAFRLRVIVHDFGLVWEYANNDERCSPLRSPRASIRAGTPSSPPTSSACAGATASKRPPEPDAPAAIATLMWSLMLTYGGTGDDTLDGVPAIPSGAVSRSPGLDAHMPEV